LKRNVDALIAFFDSRQNAPHEIGRENNDCAGYALAAVEAQTGVKVAPNLKWSTTRGIAGLIKRYGSLEAAFDAHFDRIAPAQAMRGDIGGVPDEQFGIHPMIVEGMTLVGPGDQGNRRLKRAAMTVAWSAIPKAS
jgi:hypothetical protein